MKIFIPYNEILPRKKAHDVFIAHECHAFREKGCDVTLLCGKGSLEDEAFHTHYQTKGFPIKRLPIVRKNNPFNLSWNLPFFHFCQKEIERQKPNVVILSVLKQAAYHLARKIPNTTYLYEIHELKHYPTHPGPWLEDKKVLEKADLISVTTEALKEILLSPPYSLTIPIAVIPLAVHAQKLPPPPPQPLTLMYVGQLYKGQGVEDLIAALPPHIKLKIIGGKPEEIAHINHPQVECLGFQPPYALKALVQNCHAFVAPFQPVGRMPYVAHTKLCEYIEWGRPVIAPYMPVVREHFPNDKGVIYFESGNRQSLTNALKINNLERLQREIETLSGSYTWDKRIDSYLAFLNKP